MPIHDRLHHQCKLDGKINMRKEKIEARENSEMPYLPLFETKDPLDETTHAEAKQNM